MAYEDFFYLFSFVAKIGSWLDMKRDFMVFFILN